MAEVDWTELTDGLDSNTVDRGATAGITAPDGGGNFVYGFNSLAVASGAVGLFCNQVNFAPMAKGCSIRGCIQRGASGGNTGWSSFLFACAQGTSVNDNAYMLGFSDTDPTKLVLRKGSIVTGIQATSGSGILRASTASYAIGTWVHVRMDVIVNANGDVVIDVYENDLDANPLDQVPSWQAIAGMSQYIDDALGINTGSQPYTSGRAGFACQVEDVTRRAFFDHIEVFRQT